MAFHPGYYVADIIEDMGISQTEFATRLGTTGKTISKLVNGQINLSNDLSKKLSAMMGTSVEIWLNLQTTYDQKVLEIEKEKDFAIQEDIARMIDYTYFVKVVGLPAVSCIREKVLNLCKYFMISDFSECGVAFVLLPHLKNSGVNGAVKWVNPSRVVLAMNNRGLDADKFWFSLFHEIKHVLQQKIKTVFVSSNGVQMQELNEELESIRE